MIKKLYIDWNEKITNINHLINLEVFHASSDGYLSGRDDRNSKISDQSIKDLINLKVLVIYENRNITNINQFFQVFLFDITRYYSLL